MESQRDYLERRALEEDAAAERAPTDKVRVTMNNFLSTGGDGFTVFNEGTDQLGGAVDIDAFVDYFLKHSPVSPPALDRITRTG